MSRFDKFIAEKNPEPHVNGHTGTANGRSPEESSEPQREISPSPTGKARKRGTDEEDLCGISPSHPKKKKKSAPVDNDAVFAARLQAEENGRARATRGGVNKKSTPIKKKKDKKVQKKKTSNKVKTEDDSDLDGSGSEVAERKVNRNSGFHVSYIAVSLIRYPDANAETHDSFHPLIQPTRRRNTTVASTDRQANMGLRQRKQPAGPG